MEGRGISNALSSTRLVIGRIVVILHFYVEIIMCDFDVKIFFLKNEK